MYADLGAALTHFRLIPEQPNDNPWVIDHIARWSLHETRGRWTWKFDPDLFRRTLVPLRHQLAAVQCRVALLRGDHSVVVPPDIAEYMYELMGRNAPVVSIPEAHHHLLLDQPLAFVAAVRTLLADWQHSIPAARTVTACSSTTRAHHGRTATARPVDAPGPPGTEIAHMWHTSPGWTPSTPSGCSPPPAARWARTSTAGCSTPSPTT